MVDDLSAKAPRRRGPQDIRAIVVTLCVGAAATLALAGALGGCRATIGPGWSAGGADGGARPFGGNASALDAGTVIPFARNHMNRDGLFDHSGITRASLATMHRDTAFDGTVNGPMFGTPLYVENGPQGHGAFFLATENNYVYALDETSGASLPGWPIQVGMPATQATTLLMGCLSFWPVGITGTPAIDVETRVIVFDAATADADGDLLTHTIQAWSIDDPSAGPVWTLDVAAKFPAFRPQSQLQRGAVLIVKGVAYVAFGSFNDCAPFHGWVVGVPLANPEAARAFMTPVVGAGIWGTGGPASDGTSIFTVTGNRAEGLDVDGSPAWAGSSAVFKFGPDLNFSGRPTDYFVPANWDWLDRNDLDLGSSGPLVVDAPGMNPSALVVALGKDGVAYLLDRNNLGGLDGGPLSSATLVKGIPGHEGQLINAATWATISGVTYLVAKGYFDASAADCPLPDGSLYDLLAVRLDPTAPNRMRTVWCAASNGMGSPSITLSDDAHDALVWTEGAEGDNALHAWDLATGTPLYASAAQALGQVRRFTTPIAVHGRVLVAGDGMLYAFGSTQPASP